ncbi:MAG: hypothetical protein EA425_13450 [Puniceicoccaceae bacterium]|nr:MAG: hypothetical protein EA425_13450 [Puniceicoccaceae bacterium]
MPSVFTVYNCGTGFNRDRTDEVIANLASRTQGSENRDWMINDGVGSKPGKGPTLARTPGLHDPKSGFKIKAPKFAVLKGTTKGYGWEHNVEHAVEVIKALSASTPPPATINMAGWSRGAITCHMLAHALARDPKTQHQFVNIFAFDPVPGPGNFKLDQISLPENVRNYTALIMEDEARKIMRPVILTPGDTSGSGGKYKLIPLPGAHNTAVFRIQTEVGTIGAALAHRFLTKHGTRLVAPMLLTDVQFCELYAKVRIDAEKFRAMKGSAAQRKLLGNEKRNIHNDFRDTAYFINDHHAARFRKAFPGMWSLLERGASNQAAVEREAGIIRTMAPTTYLSLQGAGII